MDERERLVIEYTGAEDELNKYLKQFFGNPAEKLITKNDYNKINELENKRDEAFKKWRDFVYNNLE